MVSLAAEYTNLASSAEQRARAARSTAVQSEDADGHHGGFHQRHNLPIQSNLNTHRFLLRLKISRQGDESLPHDENTNRSTTQGRMSVCVSKRLMRRNTLNKGISVIWLRNHHVPEPGETELPAGETSCAQNHPAMGTMIACKNTVADTTCCS